LLTEATAVQGSVLLQALIGVDGGVQELRVISGPTILVSAARQAVQQWRFKPYLVNGKPVETYARVTVNFTIDVSNTEARYHINSVTSTGAL
jgi:protein TonB